MGRGGGVAPCNDDGGSCACCDWGNMLKGLAVVIKGSVLVAGAAAAGGSRVECFSDDVLPNGKPHATFRKLPALAPSRNLGAPCISAIADAALEEGRRN